VWVTHITDNIEIRNSIPWIELKAMDVIEHLDTITVPKLIILKNLRTIICESCIENEDILDSRKSSIINISNKFNLYEVQDKMYPEIKLIKPCIKCGILKLTYDLTQYGGLCTKCGMRDHEQKDKHKHR
jgi:hypothetical protein